MKTSTPRTVVAALLFLALARPSRPAGPDPDAASVRRAIEIEEERFAQAEIRRDLDAMWKMYSDPAAGMDAAARRMERIRNSGASLVDERFEISSLEVWGEIAVESGEVVAQLDSPGKAPSIDRTRYLSVWKHQPDGSWKIARDLWSPVGASAPQPIGASAPQPNVAPATPPTAAAPAPVPPALAPLSVPEPPAGYVPIPDARDLSEGFVRTIQDDLKSNARRVRSLASSDPEKRRQSAAKADRDITKVVRDVGWIDMVRFGVRAACDAAYIVSQSADLPLMRATLPLMEKDLKNSEDGAGCYQSAIEAYRALAPR
jgi:ketosteroid isomerase-like protein